MAPSRASSICSNCLRTLRQRHETLSTRSFASTAAPRQDALSGLTEFSDQSAIPRWQQTPPAMRMPVRLRPQPKQPLFVVNSRKEVLDQVYDRFLGTIAPHDQSRSVSGKHALDEETMWLAVTHKSFDHARRGNNDRLAYLGKRIIDLQTSLALISSPNPSSSSSTSYARPSKDNFNHAALQGLESLTPGARTAVLDRVRIAKLAQSYGIDSVMRWKPRKADNLQSSGIDTVLAQTVYSIVGALSLQRGGEVAGRVVRERILAPLGLR